MKTSEILTRAAELVTTRKEYSCCGAIRSALWEINGELCSMDDKSLRAFRNAFMPERVSIYSLWFGPTTKKENQQRRVLALLMCAAIAESEGD